MRKMNISKLWCMRRSIISAALLFTLTACGAINKPFNPIDSKRTIKPSSIAVISGSYRDADIKMAEFITQGLTERSAYRVLSQDEIGRRIPAYPFIIAAKERDDEKDPDEKAIWFQPSEKEKLNAMQAKLKVDYLFVIWNSQMLQVSSRNGTTYYVYPVGNMIEYPGAKVVASTRSIDGSSTSILALFRSADYYIVDALKGASENIVDEFLDVTKSKKP